MQDSSDVTNAGKNMTMKNDPKIKSFGVKLEFYGPRYPQRNRKVEKNSTHVMEESGQC
jgi:hypothetical protein